MSLDGLKEALTQEEEPENKEKPEPIIYVQMLKSGQIQTRYPDDVMSLEDCSKILAIAATQVLKAVQEKKKITKADPRVLKELKKK